MTSFSIE